VSLNDILDRVDVPDAMNGEVAVDDDVGERSPVLVVAVPSDVDGTAEAQKVDNAGLGLEPATRSRSHRASRVSGASIPSKRIRSPATARVSPSMT